MKALFAKPTAFAFLAAVFLNAFVDLGHKIIIQNTVFKMYDGREQLVLTALVNGLILLPFILLFSPAGYSSDRYPKHKVMRISAWASVGLTLAITVCYTMGWFWAAFSMTFLLAAQSAFYSPAKMGYIRGFFGKEKLASANGLVSATSILAILISTFVFSVVFEALFPKSATNNNEVIASLVPVGITLFILAIIELVLMYQLPNVDNDVEARNKGQTFSLSQYMKGTQIKDSLKPALHNQAIRLSILGLSMFWAIGQVMLAAFPAFAKETTGEINTIAIQLVIAASGLGIALGSMIASRVSKNYIEAGLIPLGALGIALGLLVLPNLETLSLMGFAFFFIGVMGGIFIVPLNALIQFNAPESSLGKVLAGNMLFQNIAMLSFLLLTVTFAALNISSKQLLTLTACVAIIGGFYTVYKLPQSLVRYILSLVLSRRYKLNVQGMKNIPSEGGVLLLGNHISWIDWAVVQLACPRPVQFVMLKSIYERWYLNWFFKLFGCVPIEQGANSKGSLETVAKLLDEDKVVCLFPEGSISHTGQLAQFKKGFERAASLSEKDFSIIPFYLRGLWGSYWSRSSDRYRRQTDAIWKRDLIVAFGPALHKTSSAKVVKQCVFDLSVSSWQDYIQTLPSLPHAWINTCKQKGTSPSIADGNTTLSNISALSVAWSFAKRMKRISREQNIGLLLPTSAGGVLANMATLLLGKTLVNLNYSAPGSAIESALNQAKIRTVYTSERFLNKLEARGIPIRETLKGVRIVYLEAFKKDISKTEFLFHWLCTRCLPAWMLNLLLCKKKSVDSTAAILFSSGSEGEPKGVELSHKNIMANLKQISSVLNMQNNDSVMASLPLFHAFGLTVTQFMPLIEGLPIITHPDPTDALGISKAVAKHKATIMCGTSTFLRLYCRNSKIHPLMLDSLRLVISGAEKLKPEVRELFHNKFNKTILEGYGATETTPVASVNMPDTLDLNSWKTQQGSKTGTVGLPLPGTSFKIVDPESYEVLPNNEDGMILIGGAQVMKGYLKNKEKTKGVIRYIDNMRWYVTGDKGHIDDDGFLSIVDRYSRFAKIGGEMISLSAVEQTVSDAMANQFPDLEAVAVNVSDDKKGEKIILLIEEAIELSSIKHAMQAQGCSSLMLPSACYQIEALPKLGSGKTDFSKAKAIAQELEVI